MEIQTSLFSLSPGGIENEAETYIFAQRAVGKGEYGMAKLLLKFLRDRKIRLGNSDDAFGLSCIIEKMGARIGYTDSRGYYSEYFY